VTTELSRMTGYRISCDDGVPIIVTRDFDASVEIKLLGEDTSILLSVQAAALLAKALGELTADAPTAEPAKPARAGRGAVQSAILGVMVYGGERYADEIIKLAGCDRSSGMSALAALCGKGQMELLPTGLYRLPHAEPAGERAA
jgi:hypothetical protein